MAEEQNEFILVVEDSPPNLKILVHLLERLGYSTIACADGSEAWDKLNSDATKDIVAIVSDIMMPNMDGIELLRKVRGSKEFKDTPFLLISALSDKDYVVEAKNLEVNGYILKPVTFKRVTEKLKQLFPERRFPRMAG